MTREWIASVAQAVVQNVFGLSKPCVTDRPVAHSVALGWSEAGLTRRKI